MVHTVYVCVCVRVRASACVRVCVCVRMCVRVYRDRHKWREWGLLMRNSQSVQRDDRAKKWAVHTHMLG